jgi:hypothetical protein
MRVANWKQALCLLLALALAGPMGALAQPESSAGAPQGAAAEPPSVAALEPEAAAAVPAPAPTGSALQRAPLAEQGQLELVSPTLTRFVAALDLPRAQGCTGEACAALLGGPLGAQPVATVRIVRLDGTYGLRSATATDVAGAEARTVSERFGGDPAHLLALGTALPADRLTHAALVAAGAPPEVPPAGPSAPLVSAAPQQAASSIFSRAWFWWAVGGVVIAAVALAASGKKSDSDGADPTTSVRVNW